MGETGCDIWGKGGVSANKKTMLPDHLEAPETFDGRPRVARRANCESRKVVLADTERSGLSHRAEVELFGAAERPAPARRERRASAFLHRVDIPFPHAALSRVKPLRRRLDVQKE